MPLVADALADQTVAEVWFASAEDAEAAGFAPAGGAAAQKVEK